MMEMTEGTLSVKITTAAEAGRPLRLTLPTQKIRSMRLSCITLGLSINAWKIIVHAVMKRTTGTGSVMEVDSVRDGGS
jgi:hypothetical protein